MTRPIIEMKNVVKSFGLFQALHGIDLRVKEGEIVVIIGPSGSGKSTLIRCINQLEDHNGGVIIVDGAEVGRGRKSTVLTEVGMVFQSFNLFPHMTVLRNVALGPVRVRPPATSALTSEEFASVVYRGSRTAGALSSATTTVSGGVGGLPPHATAHSIAPSARA